MLACVCQPTETALLFKGGPPISMGPLGTNRVRHTTNAMEALKLIQRADSKLNSDLKSSSASSPSLISKGSLLNLRKIERKAKSTKILINPVCTDSIGSSDDSQRSKHLNSKWNGKKKRLKTENSKMLKKCELESDKNDPITRNEARDDTKSISCFKMKSTEDKSCLNEDRKLGKENCANENASNLLSSKKNDIINHPWKNSKEILVDESCMTDRTTLKTDQFSTGKTDSAIVIKEIEVSKMFFVF